MSNQASLPPDAINPSISRPASEDAAAISAKLSPKVAILNAAIVSLEYARQYLDKFLYWPDYILATHYHASVLALTKSKDNWNEAETCFKDVESWLQPADKHRRFDEARKRIRAEAMYNRAILLQRKGQTAEAKKQFQSVLRVMGEKRNEPPRGVRFATEFALLMLIARDLPAPAQEAMPVGAVSAVQPSSLERMPTLGNEWQAAAVPFLANSRNELQRLEGDLDSAESELFRLESELNATKPKLASTKKGQRQAAAYPKEVSDIESKCDDAKARITKASKDLAILRMMEATVDKLYRDLSSNPRPSGSGPFLQGPAVG